jgi:hypothetical protein
MRTLVAATAIGAASFIFTPNVRPEGNVILAGKHQPLQRAAAVKDNSA